MTKTYLKNKINRGIFLTLSIISIFFVSNQSFAAPCKNRTFGGGWNGLYGPAQNQYCKYSNGGEGDCNDNRGCENGKVECGVGQYCVKQDWEIGYRQESGNFGNRWVCVECADIPRDTPLVLKQGAIKLEKVEFGQAIIDPNLIEY